MDDAVKVAALNALYGIFGISFSSKAMPANITVDPSTNQMNNSPIHKWCTKNIDKLVEKKTTI